MSPTTNQGWDSNNDQAHLIFDQDPISLEPHDDPITLIHDDILPYQAQTFLPFPIHLSLPKWDQDHPSTFSIDENPSQHQSISSPLDHPKEYLIPSCPSYPTYITILSC